MTDRSESFRIILKASSIIGGASTFNMLVAIVKVKGLAVLLGPTGIGLMGLYQNIMSLASTLAGCGINSSGIRQLAGSRDDVTSFVIVRRALWSLNLGLGLAGMCILWVVRESIACWVFGDIDHASEVGWLGLGVLFTLIAGSQTAQLQGLRRIADLALVSTISAFIGAVVGLSLVYWLGEKGVLWFVLTAPVVSTLVAAYCAARLSKKEISYNWQAICCQGQEMLKLGIPIMLAGLLALATQLSARSIILHELGLNAAGYFQAAWAISMTYIGFVLSAMGADYYPRLTSIINDYSLARNLVNEQSEVALLLAGPVLLVMCTFAPWVIYLLYDSTFAQVAEVLRWQILGDILKVSSWPMGFILLAQGRGRLFIATEIIWSVSYLSIIILGIEKWGLVIVGVGFWIAYLILFVVLTCAGFRLIGFRLAQRSWLLTLLLMIACCLIIFAAERSVEAGYTIGLIVTLTMSIYSLYRLDSMVDLRGWLSQRIKG